MSIPSQHQKEIGALNAELLTGALREVRQYYIQYNESLFGGLLTIPQLEWMSTNRTWGQWLRESRCLRLSQDLLERNWGQLVEVLKHEMAHQYVDEVEGLPFGEGPHGSTFRTICHARGIDARAAGDLDNVEMSEHSSTSPPEGDEDAERRRTILKRIESLLSLAQSSNQHEAENAMATARRLMLKYNLSQSVLSTKHAYAFRHVGRPTGRRMAWQRALSSILIAHFFVDVIIINVYRPAEKKQGTVLELCGTPANLEIAAYAHDFLEQTAHELWRNHKRENKIRRDRDRQSFLYGVMVGFYEKLQAEKAKSEAEGLIWVGDPGLKEYCRARHPYLRAVSSRGQVRAGAIDAGKEAGGRIVLHRGVSEGKNTGAPRLLGAGDRA